MKALEPGRACQVQASDGAPIDGGEDALVAAARQEIRGDDLARAKLLWRKALLLNPDLVFVEIGLAKAYRRRGLGFPTFEQRVRGRFHDWYRSPARDKAAGHIRCTPVTELSSEADWKCCSRWPRKLGSKMNMRRFAQRHNVPVPRLLYFGKDLDEVVTWPDRFVCKVSNDGAGLGVMVMVDGVNLHDRRHYTIDEMKAYMLTSLKRSRNSSHYLVEEYLVDEQRRPLPVDYKLHVFGGRVGLVQVIDRNGPPGKRVSHSFFSRAWTEAPLPIKSNKRVVYGVERPPLGLNRMIEWAEQMGEAIGRYMRIDFYSTLTGPLFGEFTCNPDEGRNFSAYGDRVLSQLWDIYGEPRLGDANPASPWLDRHLVGAWTWDGYPELKPAPCSFLVKYSDGETAQIDCTYDNKSWEQTARVTDRGVTWTAENGTVTELMSVGEGQFSAVYIRLNQVVARALLSEPGQAVIRE